MEGFKKRNPQALRVKGLIYFQERVIKKSLIRCAITAPTIRALLFGPFHLTKKRCFHVVALQNDYCLFVIKEETMATMMSCIVHFQDGHRGLL